MSEEEGNRQSTPALLAKWGMTASVGGFLLAVLFNPGFGLALSFLEQSLWPIAIPVAGFMILVLAPVGVVMSAISLCMGGFEDRKRILLPAMAGVIAGLVTGIPVGSGFLAAKRIARARTQVELNDNRVTPPVQHLAVVQSVTMTAPSKAPVSPHAAGVFIPAPQRVDMVSDSKRKRLYITAGDAVLQYQMDTKTFLQPMVLGGNLQGIDISPDGDWLAVADASGSNRRIWIYLVNLRDQTNERVTFQTAMESGTYSVAYGEDGVVWISSTLNGSGFVRLRKYDPRTRTGLEVGSVSKNTMLSASADRKTIGFAQAGVTPGSYGQFYSRATQLPKPVQAPSFLYEVGISRDGVQVAAPAYDQVFILGSAVSGLPDRECVGVVYHPQRDFVFLSQAGTSLVEAYDSRTYGKAKELDFGSQFQWMGGTAFDSGRLRVSSDGALLFCTVLGGIRYMETGL